jgi:hypothetical protein
MNSIYYIKYLDMEKNTNSVVVTVKILSILLFMLCSGLTLQAQYTLDVDLSDKIRPVTHCASGSLYGMTETLPTDIENLVAPLKPYMFCQPPRGGNDNQHPYGSAIVVSERLESTTGVVQITLADILKGWPYNWPGKDTWLALVRSVIEEKLASGRDNYHSYTIWNERHGTWRETNGDFYTECWVPTYNLIRSMDPSAIIVGPGDAYYNNSRISEFLTYCKNNNCMPDMLSWHQWGSGGFASAYNNYRQLERSLNISPLPLCINEYSSQTSDPYEGCPGYSVPFIAKFERYGIESACISWWHTQYPGRLGSLLTPSNEKGGGWYLYKWYGDMSGDMIKTVPPDDYSDGIDGFGCIDEEKYFASICIGGNNTGTVNVEITGIPATFGSQVNVAVDYVTWVDKDTPVSGTNSISNTVYNVSNRSISVPVNVTSNLYAYRVHITPVNIVGPPMVEITNPVEGDIFISPATIPIQATASDEDGTVSKVDFYNGNTLLFSDNSAPYSYDWQDVTEGVYIIKAVATDNEGNTNEDVVTVRFNLPQGAYGGTPSPIPGTIQFENYDVGGNGFAYLDNSTDNTGGSTFRTDEDVDLENCTDAGTGYNLGFATAGEWLEYTVSVATTGKYNLVIRSACNGDGRTISFLMDDKDIAGNIAVPNTGGWQTWTNIEINDVQLEAGEHILRLTVGDVDYVNLNYIVFEAVDVPPVVNITSPGNQSVFLANESVSISATATSENASIVTVNYYANDELLGANNSSPYSFIWENMTEGSYTIKVEAEDNSGLISYDEITVTINAAPVEIQLKAGWNLIGCPIEGSTDISSALSSIWNNVVSVKDMNHFYISDQPEFFNTLQTVEWGKGYLIKVSTDCTLLWK